MAKAGNIGSILNRGNRCFMYPEATTKYFMLTREFRILTLSPGNGANSCGVHCVKIGFSFRKHCIASALCS